MPIYTYKCSTCNKQTEVIKAVKDLEREEVCTQCDKQMHRVLSLANPHVWKPDWWEHIGPEPIYIESKEQLLRECAKHDCYASGYMNIGPSQHGVKRS